MKVDSSFVLCDKALPFEDTEEGGTFASRMIFSYSYRYHALPYVEKALAVYLGGYKNLAGYKNIPRIF